MAGKLALAHRLNLRQRPHVTDAEIDALVTAGVLFTWPGGQTVAGAGVGLPGVMGDGRLMGQPSWAVAIPNVDGLLAGVQIRNPEGGYFWASTPNRGGATPHVDGELPLGIYGTPHGGVAELDEGYFKPALTQTRYGGLHIGMAGGQWANSPQQLRAVFDSHDITQAVLNADGGAIQNPNVLGAYRKLASLLEGWGITLQVRWWGQAEKVHGDVDEISPDTYHGAKWLTWAEFEDMAPVVTTPRRNSWAERLAQRLTRKLTPQDSANALKKALGHEPYAGHEYEPGQRLATWKDAVANGYRYILDQSGTGAGKSHDTGLAIPEDFGVAKLLYLSAGHYAPTAPTLAQWPDLHGRHNGLTREAQADGLTRLKRAGRGDEKVVPANCGRTDLIHVLRAKNIHGADQASVVCNTCPLQDACRHSEGNGYGYLHQRQQGLTAPRLRLHPDAAPGDDFGWADTVAIWDEPAESFSTSKTVAVTAADVEATLARLAMADSALLESLRPLLTALRLLFEAKQGKYGLDHATILAALPAVPEVDLAALRDVLEGDLTDILDPELEDGLRVSDLAGRSTHIRSASGLHGPRETTINLRATFGHSPNQGRALAETLPKQWLPDLLTALKERGRLHLSFDTLTLTLPNPRHRDIVQAAKATLFLDATLSREDLALMLGCDVDDIYCTRQRATEHKAKLKLIQVTDLGRLGMQRGADQERRLAALLTHLKDTEKAKVIDFKKFADHADGAWWRDSRGSNAFQGVSTLVLVGTPCPNLAALEADWLSMTGRQPEASEDFAPWLTRKIQADILQGIGRLRANRRPGASLTVYLLTNLELDLPVEVIAAKDITLAAATKLEKTEMAIRAAVAHLQQTGAKVTQAAVAKLAKVSQGYVSRCFGELLQTLLGDSNSKSNNFSGDDPPPEVARLIWGAIDLADTPQTLVESVCDLLNGLVDPSNVLGLLLAGPPDGPR
ncbi:hypothetical protein GFS31_44460 (plasmid) [Leptolyngbya sp. BL0902]|nr:hypothetical protein GFS31_44460 [Leptolyngbya sp. BL0902]